MTHQRIVKFKMSNQARLLAVCLTLIPGTGILHAQSDPGPRGGAAGAGGAFPGLDANEQQL